jgi:hypothetical protein
MSSMVTSAGLDVTTTGVMSSLTDRVKRLPGLRRALRGLSCLPMALGAECCHCRLRVPVEHAVNLFWIQPEDPSAAIDGQRALGDSTSQGLHTDPCAGRSRR